MKDFSNDILSYINRGYRKKYDYIDYEITVDDINKYSGYVILYIPKEDNLNFWIIEKYYFKKVKYISKFNNLLKNDKNFIYLLYINENEQELIYTIHYLYYFNFDIFIENKHLEYVIYNKYNESVNEYSKKLYDKLNYIYNLQDEENFKLFYENYIKPIIINFAKAEVIAYNYEVNSNKDIMELYNLRGKLIMNMLSVRKSDLKKTTELIYLKLFRDNFPDVIYQYRCDWLNKQSIDLFIPSKNVGVEVQGIQHYEPVDFFGGKEQLKKQKQLDEQKRILCENHNIILLYIDSRKDNYIEVINYIKNIK